MAVAVTVRMCVRVRVRVTIAAALVGSVPHFDVPWSHGYRPARHGCRAWAGGDPWPVSRDPVSTTQLSWSNSILTLHRSCSCKDEVKLRPTRFEPLTYEGLYERSLVGAPIGMKGAGGGPDCATPKPAGLKKYGAHMSVQSERRAQGTHDEGYLLYKYVSGECTVPKCGLTALADAGRDMKGSPPARCLRLR